MTNYKIKTKVVALEEKTHIVGTYSTGVKDGNGKLIYENKVETLGWFVTFEGSWESLFLGMEKPEAVVGQVVTIIVQF